jgi:hypothetical protein
MPLASRNNTGIDEATMPTTPSTTEEHAGMNGNVGVIGSLPWVDGRDPAAPGVEGGGH